MTSLANDHQRPEAGRRQPRTHVFVTATLYAEAGSAPVNIRNMSPSGALVEAAVLPAPGTWVWLRRGGLEAGGRIAWQEGRRAGVALDTMIHIADWTARQANAGQARADAVVAHFRAKRPLPAPIATLPPSIEAELQLVRSELAALEAALVGDSIVVATHPEIQSLDICLQRVDRVLKRLRGGG